MQDSRSRVSRTLGPRQLTLSYVLAVLTAVATLSGLLIEGTYRLEKPLWAAQAAGQDLVTLIVAIPLLVASAVLTVRGSPSAYMLWVGVLIYLTYSYLIYASFVHFGPLFPVYIGILSLSFFLLLGLLLLSDFAQVIGTRPERLPVRLAAAYLLVLSGVFFLFEGGAVAVAILRGSAPQSAIDVGLQVDPVHVVDLAFLLPALVVIGVLLRRRHPLGYFLAGPLLVHMVILGVAILAMFLVMIRRGFSPPLPPMVGFVTSTALSIALGAKYLRAMAGQQRSDEIPEKA